MEMDAPICCDRQVTLVRAGQRAGFNIGLWRCTVCERFETTHKRYDGENFFVAAMGRAVLAKADELIADAYAWRS